MKKISEMRIVIVLLLISATLLCGCGDSGGMDDGEETVTPVVVAPSGPPAFSYEYSAENIDVPFHAYSNTKFRVIHTGECEYSFELFTYDPNSDATEFYDEIAHGTGACDQLFYYNLAENYYLLIPDIAPITGTEECNWHIEVESIFSNTSGNSSGSGSSSNSCPYSIQGCCSSHGGAVRCENGRVKCGDGTFSPTCTCVCP